MLTRFVCLALSCASITALAQTPAAAPLVVHTLRDQISWVEGAGGNSGVIVGDKGVVVIDAKISAAGAQELLADIAKITPKPVNTVILTHSDRDHVNGLAGFPKDIAVVGHEQEREEEEKAISAGGKDAPSPDRLPTHIVKGAKEAATFDGVSFQLLHWGAAHTNGDLVIFLPKEKVAFTGDLMTNRPDPLIHAEKNGTSAGWIEAARGLVALNADTYVAGHGPTLTGEQIRTYLARVEQKRAQIQQLVSQGKSLDEVKSAVGDPAPANGSGPTFATFTEVVYRELSAKSGSK